MTSKPNRKEAVLAMLFALMVLSAAVASIAAPPITKAQTPGVWMAPPYVVTRQAVLPDSEGTSNPNFGGFCEGLGRQWVFFVGGGYGNSPGSWESSANDGQNWTSAQLTPFATANFFRVTCYGSTVYLVTNWEYGSADLYSGTLEDNGSISWSPTMNTAPSGPVGVSDYVSSIAFSASGYGLMLASGSAVYTYISGSSWNRILDVAGETGTCPTYSGILGATWLDNGEIAVIGECSVGGGLYLIGQTWVGTSWSSVKTITWAASSGDLVEAYLTHTGNTTDVWTNVGNTFDFFTYADSVGFTQTLSDSSSCSVYFCASYIASNDQGTLLAPYMTGSGFDYCASTDNGTTWSCGNLLAVNNDDGSGLCGAGEGCGEAIFSGDAYPVFWGQQGENVDVAEILDTHTAHIFLRFGPGMLSGDAVVNGTLHQLPWNYASQIGDLTTAVAPANVGTYDFLDWSNGTQYPSRTVEMETGVFNTTVFVANYRGVNYGNLVEGDWSGWSLALATNIPYSFPYRTYPIMGVDSLGTAYFGASTNVVENDPTTYVVFLNGTTDLINNTTPATLGQPYSAYGTYEVVPQTEGTTGYFLPSSSRNFPFSKSFRFTSRRAR